MTKAGQRKQVVVRIADAVPLAARPGISLNAPNHPGHGPF